MCLRIVNFKYHLVDADMTVKSPKFALCVCQMFAMCLLLGGCGPRYGIKNHRAYGSADTWDAFEYPSLRMEQGELIRGVTPAKGPLFGGYWLGIYVENPEVARHLPREGDFLNGTDIEAVAEGRTKAYYLNAVHLIGEGPLDAFYTDDADWFWIEVVKPSLEP
ncbi:Unannotated [Lentimonas sp. CC19]|nr:Unannotated [Lentimonas sp. CC4]CAA6685776.1 Unannotated [Lentimonas sp. CC6]CAA6695053.1 Unannotated [Lentimonas sp. CC19]CAA6697179.1 Unannotated [Lentimonas sp. CC10]CAA7069835.1 Unannotated [Lentimonas sp. CC11]CAA7171916.1 Unannotated [Lentimonas sp. CC21]CAA7181504.1 Unannotated [Lentimonas sp. CC8]